MEKYIFKVENGCLREVQVSDQEARENAKSLREKVLTIYDAMKASAGSEAAPR